MADVSALTAEIERLKQQVSDLSAALAQRGGSSSEQGGATAGSGAVSSSSAGSSGGAASSSGIEGFSIPRSISMSKLKLKAEELEAMKQIFELFDADHDGLISTSDLVQLHAKLGEPLTPSEAMDAVAIVGGGKDVISFVDLVSYWDGSHPALRRGEKEDDVLP